MSVQQWKAPGALGAHRRGGACEFRVWAPNAERVDVHLTDANRTEPLHAEGRGYFSSVIDNIAVGARYTFVQDGERELPDPASRSQPDGVHKPSAVVTDTFAWAVSRWNVPRLRDLVIQEIHVGTFTSEGTFDAIIADLDRLRNIGINTIELLPIAQFPGTRNWGYDGVFPFAAQHSYGGANALKRLVDAVHVRGMIILLDVVYNHVGPEGNYLPAYGPYFTGKYRTPWGQAVNYDDTQSDEVRAFFIQSALQWIDEFRFDGLRFDAVHAIVDASARPFLAEMTDALRARADKLHRTIHLIAESDLSDPRMISATDSSGFGFDAQWLDDFHHALHALATGETQGYYSDYGDIQHLAATLQRAYVYDGAFSAHRGRRHGAPLHHVEPQRFIVCAQNHDQIGNRLAGDRLSTLVDFDLLKLTAAATLLGPYVPMLFMGEEYGEVAPFPYFVSHGDAELVEAVRKGRREEFKSFGWADEPPDPQSEDTFRSAMLDRDLAHVGWHAAILALHRDLIAVRRSTPLLHTFESADVRTEGDVIIYTRAGTHENESQQLILTLNFGAQTAVIDAADGADLVITTDAPVYANASQPEPARNDARTIGPHTAALYRRKAH